MKRLSDLFLPTIVGITVYLLVSKLFPEKISDLSSEIEKDVKGGDIVRNPFIQNIIKKCMHDRALKAAVFSLFFTAGFKYFKDEVKTLLSDEIFKEICVKEVDGRLKIVCDIITEHELNLHSKSMKAVIVTNDLSHEEKIDLLKIKLDFILNGECGGKKRFIILSILALFMTFCVSGVSGLAIFLEALYRLFQEGKISRALYEDIIKTVTKRAIKIPVDHLS
jgi:hypothetical protein